MRYPTARHVLPRLSPKPTNSRVVIMRPRSLEHWARSISRAEPRAQRWFERFLPAAGPGGIVGRFEVERGQYVDEPKLVLYRAELLPTNAISEDGYREIVAQGGRGCDELEAAVGALFEAFERYALSIYRRGNLAFGSLSEMSGCRTVSPAHLLPHDASRSSVEAEVERRRPWVSGISVVTGERYLVPAQAVFVPYFGGEEPLLREPITTGAAAGLSDAHAAFRGLLEVVERDALMLAHYCGAPVGRIRNEDLPPVSSALVAELRRYSLEVDVFRVDNGISVHNVVARIQDHTGVGPRATFGSKSSLDLSVAVEGAVHEAASCRRGLRDRLTVARRYASSKLTDSRNIDCLEARAYYWIANEDRASFDYLDAAVAVLPDPNPGVLEFLDSVARVSDIYVVDVTTPDVRSFGAYVCKVIAPSLQPMHLNERYWLPTKRAHAFARRHRTTEQSLPHPFL